MLKDVRVGTAVLLSFILVRLLKVPLILALVAKGTTSFSTGY
jgi:cobalamin synthase